MNSLRDLSSLFKNHKPSLRTFYLPSPTKVRRRGSVLIRTPYNAAQMRGQAMSWANAGYDAFIQDVRGRYGSQGTWEPYTYEAEDGLRTIETLNSAGLLDDTFFLVGASYEAHTALTAAEELCKNSQKPAGVIAMVPALGLWDTAHAPDGTPRLYDRIGWWLQHGYGAESHTPISEEKLKMLTQIGRQEGALALLQHPPFSKSAHLQQQWTKLWQEKAPSFETRWANIKVPLLAVGGDADFFAEDTRNLYAHWHASASLIWGPWGHGLGTEWDYHSKLRVELRESGGLFPHLLQWMRKIAHHPEYALNRTFIPSTGHGLPRWEETTKSELRKNLSEH